MSLPLRTVYAFISLITVASSTAAPGGHLLEGISDECDMLSSIWKPGLRGLPEVLTVSEGMLSLRSVDNGDDEYPSAEDMISTYADQIGRSLTAAEGPSVVTWLWLPPFSEWPTGVNAAGLSEWLGFRVTAFDTGLPNGFGFYFPGIFVGTENGGPVLIARVGDGYTGDVVIRQLEATGWWTLGIAFNADGRTEYYAAPGRVSLTNAHLLHTTPTQSDSAANRSIDELVGNFWALRMTYPSTGELSPNWTTDFFRVYVTLPPAVPVVRPRIVSGTVELAITGCSRGFRYLLQRSIDLLEWEDVDDVVSDGETWFYQEPATERAFYRVKRP